MIRKIGILSLQGAFVEHQKILHDLGVDTFLIRQKKDIANKSFDGMIIPGGESTVMGKLLYDLDLFDPLNKLISSGMPTFGTCAGVILLAKTIAEKEESFFSAIDISVRRNAYGRQLGSFTGDYDFSNDGKIPMVFIRAPIIEKIGASVQVLAKIENNIVAARNINILVTTFHPELTRNYTVHKYFLEKLGK